MLRQIGKNFVIDGFIDNGDQDSAWSLRLSPGRTPDALIFGLYWADKETATHRVIVRRSELLNALGVTVDAS